MVKRLRKAIGSWTALERLTRSIRAWFEGEDEFEDEPDLPGAPATAVSPVVVEKRFMSLHLQGRIREMWEMLADDAQQAWGGPDNFVRDLPRMGSETELLDMQVMGVRMLGEWTDEAHGRTYRNVAQMVMRYRLRHLWRDWTFDREVHLVQADDGWRTLCYPVRAKTSEAVGSR